MCRLGTVFTFFFFHTFCLGEYRREISFKFPDGIGRHETTDLVIIRLLLYQYCFWEDPRIDPESYRAY